MKAEEGRRRLAKYAFIECMKNIEYQKEKERIALRDFFAGCALVVLYSHEEYRRQGNNRMASDAFELADAMMKEREK